MILADKIITLRKKNGWSQEDLADLLEVSRQSVSKWETGSSVPELDKLVKLSGLFGVGLGQGTPDKIPAYYNDFIFAVVCEQLGIVFGVCLIAAYVILLLRGMEVSVRARRSFDMLLGCGVVAMLGVQTFMIVAGVIKMIPLTGVTMPFLSYGGSSLVSCFFSMGVLLGISSMNAEDEARDVELIEISEEALL